MAIAELFSAGSNPDKRRAQAWLKDRLERGKSEVFTETVDLTPALAEMLLARNPDNRTISARTVEVYVSDISEGRWDLNGEALKISSCGSLNDGQHRCTAVVQSGRSISTLVTFGLRRESRLTEGQGKARTPGDYLSMMGVKEANVTAATASFVFQFENYGELIGPSSQSRRPTKGQTLESLKKHPEIVESVAFVPSRNAILIGGKSLVAFCHWLIARQDKAGADEFITRLMRGDGLEIGDPIHTVRERLMSPKNKKLLSRNDKALSILKAWELYRRNRQSSRIQTGNLSLRDYL